MLLAQRGVCKQGKIQPLHQVCIITKRIVESSRRIVIRPHQVVNEPFRHVAAFSQDTELRWVVHPKDDDTQAGESRRLTCQTLEDTATNKKHGITFCARSQAKKE